jgi:hypothetical protein
MNTITIQIDSVDFEKQDISLTSDQVLGLYQLKKEQSTRIIELEKEIKQKETNLKYKDDNLTEVKNELQQGHALLSALGVKEKTEEEEVYYRKPLSITTRLAIYLATK